ncbi:MAG: Dabb family protein [Ruminococcaceae bacterium]|nr:Dabb family protein [Oscillospiraceae bacterium]
MIRHVVMWKFKNEAEGKTKLENMEWVREHLYALVPIIPEIKRMEIGFDITGSDMSMDLMLLTEFDSVEEMKIYANHEEHLKVSKYVRSVIESRVVLDCEI